MNKLQHRSTKIFFYRGNFIPSLCRLQAGSSGRCFIFSKLKKQLNPFISVLTSEKAKSDSQRLNSPQEKYHSVNGPGGSDTSQQVLPVEVLKDSSTLTWLLCDDQPVLRCSDNKTLVRGVRRGGGDVARAESGSGLGTDRSSASSKPMLAGV